MAENEKSIATIICTKHYYAFAKLLSGANSTRFSTEIRVRSRSFNLNRTYCLFASLCFDIENTIKISNFILFFFPHLYAVYFYTALVPVCTSFASSIVCVVEPGGRSFNEAAISPVRSHDDVHNIYVTLYLLNVCCSFVPW